MTSSGRKSSSFVFATPTFLEIDNQWCLQNAWSVIECILTYKLTPFLFDYKSVPLPVQKIERGSFTPDLAYHMLRLKLKYETNERKTNNKLEWKIKWLIYGESIIMNIIKQICSSSSSSKKGLSFKKMTLPFWIRLINRTVLCANHATMRIIEILLI